MTWKQQGLCHDENHGRIQISKGSTHKDHPLDPTLVEGLLNRVIRFTEGRLILVEVGCQIRVRFQVVE